MKYTFKEDPHGSHSKILSILKRFRGKKILEVGCGDGFFSEKIAPFHEVWGIEIDPDEAGKAKRFCRKVFVGDVGEMELGERFDIILLADLLEHTRNPEDVLKKVRGWLSEKGMVIVSIPNVAHFYVRLLLLLGRFDYGDKGLLDRTHLRFFTKRNAEKLLRETGFSIVEEDITPLPLLEIFGAKRNRFSDSLESINYNLSKIWKTLFAYQFIFVATRA